MKILVRVITKDQPTEALRNVCAEAARMAAPLPDDWEIGRTRNKYSIEMGRATAIKEARDADADRLIMLDDDVVPRPEGLIQLVADDVPVVAGIVPVTRDGLIFWNAFQLDDKRSVLRSILGKGQEGGLEDVYAVGAAVICLRKDILQRTDLDPLFDFDKNEDGTGKGLFSGDDLTFCKKCQEAEIPVRVDHRVVVEHQTEVRLLEIIMAGKQHAGIDPNGGFPSCYRFDVREFSCDFPGSGYFARRRDVAGTRPTGPLSPLLVGSTLAGRE